MCKPASVFACFSEPASNPPQFLRVFGVAASPSRAPFVVFPSHFARPPQTRLSFCVFLCRCLSLACCVDVFSFTFCPPASSPPQFLRVFGVGASPSRAPFVVLPSRFARQSMSTIGTTVRLSSSAHSHLAFQAEPLKAQISNESSYTTTCKHCLRSREDNSVTNYDKTDLQSALPWSPSIALGPGHCQGRKPQATWGAAPTTWGAAPRQPWGAAPGSPPSSYVYVLFFFPYKKGAPRAPPARGGLLFIREEEENINI